MKLSTLSKNIRMLCGSQLMLLGYLPILIGILGSKTSSDTEISKKKIINASEIISQKSKNATISGDFTIWNRHSKSSNNFMYFPADSSVNGVFFDNRILNEKSQNIEKTLASTLLHDKFIKNDILNIAYLPYDKVLEVQNAISAAKTQGISEPPVSSEKITVTITKEPVNQIKIIKKGEFTGSYFARSKINSNFYADARKLGIPTRVIDAVINTLSLKINFRRTLNKGDSFEVLYNKKNELLYAKISTKRNTAAIYGVATKNKLSYFFENGEKVSFQSGNMFGSPLAGRLIVSDAYGMRRHPFTGKYAYHAGVDFRAAYGTPVHAIMDGVVTRASSYFGYGYCVDIRHASGYSSRYAHLSKFAVRYGDRVKKNQVIGYIGSTGLSTGAHLHLELARYNKNLNPLSVKMMQKESDFAPKNQLNSFKNKVRKAIGIL